MPTLATAPTASLEQRLASARTALTLAETRLDEAEKDFDEKSLHAPLAQFQTVEAEVRRQTLLVAACRTEYENAERDLANQRQQEADRQLTAERIAKKASLIGELYDIAGKIKVLEERKREPIDYQLSVLNGRRSTVLRELARYKDVE